MRAEEIKGLMEAYSKIHETPEVLSEEVVEEVEQLDEVRYDVERAKTAARNRDAALGLVGNQARRLANATIDSFKTDKNPTKGKDTFASPTSTAKPTTKPKPTSGSRLDDPIAGKGPKGNEVGSTPKPVSSGSSSSTLVPKPSSVVLAKRGGVEGKLDKATGKFTAGAFSGAEKSRYSQYSPKPASTSTPAPATPTKPAAVPKTPNPLMQKTFGYQTGNAPDQIAKASQGVSKETSDRAFAKSKEMVKSFKPSPNLKMDLDIFDIVKGYLLDEGYAETEENAMVIMVNMSEEWRESILESCGVHLDEASYSAKAARAGEDIGKPGKQFEKIAKEAGERYGSKERGEKVAGAVLAKLRAKKG
jgi:hypothetical protein